MKTLLRTVFSFALLFGASGLAGAAGGGDDGSQLAVVVFLGMCALIVILQLVPLLVLVIGSLRALGKEKPAQAAEVARDNQAR